MNVCTHAWMYVCRHVNTRACRCACLYMHTYTHIDILTRATVVPSSALPAQRMGRLCDRALVISARCCCWFCRFCSVSFTMAAKICLPEALHLRMATPLHCQLGCVTADQWSFLAALRCGSPTPWNSSTQAPPSGDATSHNTSRLTLVEPQSQSQSPRL